MRKQVILLGLFILVSFNISAQENDTLKIDEKEYQEYFKDIDTTSLGSNLSLEAVAELFRTSKDLEDFEKKLNDADDKVNNLDLNGDGEVDYLRVVDHKENNTHVIVIQAVLGKDLYKDVASIDVIKEGDKISLQIVGDEEIYGTSYFLEPEKEEEVKSYPTVVFIFSVGYTPYYSPYYWGYYPPYYRPWPPYYHYHYHRRMYRHYHYHRYHHHKHHYHRHHSTKRHPHSKSVHKKHYKTAPVKQPNYSTRPASPPPSSTKPSTQPKTNNKQQPKNNQAKPQQQPKQVSPQQPKNNQQAKPQQQQPQQPKNNQQTKPQNRNPQPKAPRSGGRKR